jgi:hypothetical protein
MLLVLTANIKGEPTCNLTVENNLDNLLYVYQQYDKPFKVINNDYFTGYNKSLEVIVEYSIMKSGEKNSTLTNSSVISVKKYTTASTGLIMVQQKGNYTICAKVSCLHDKQQNNLSNISTGNISNSTHEHIIINNSIINNTASSSNKCWSAEFLDGREISCNITIGMRTDKKTYNPGDAVKIYFDVSNQSFPYQITYWIEDYFGRVVKKTYTTSNSNTKSYTVKEVFGINELSIRANYSVGCNMSDIPNVSHKVLVKGTILNSSSAVLKKYDVKQKSDYTIVEGELYIYSKYGLSYDNCKMELYQKSRLATESFKIVPFINASHSFRLVVDNSKLKRKDHTLQLSGCANATFKITIPVPATKEVDNKINENIREKEDLSFNVTIPEKIYSNKSFSTRLSINGNDGKRLRIINYVYRASKCYSVNCKEDYNYAEFKGNSVVQLNNKAIVANAGIYEYRLIVEYGKNILYDYRTKMLIEDLVLNKKEIKLTESKDGSDSNTKVMTDLSNPNTNLSKDLTAITGMNVYKSKNEKIKEIIPFGIIIALALVNFAVIIHY